MAHLTIFIKSNLVSKLYKNFYFGISSLPACGQNEEVLNYHNLKKMLNTIKKLLMKNRTILLIKG